jgi:tRNA(fMet)-specific endonuclease VapC
MVIWVLEDDNRDLGRAVQENQGHGSAARRNTSRLHQRGAQDTSRFDEPAGLSWIWMAQRFRTGRSEGGRGHRQPPCRRARAGRFVGVALILDTNAVSALFAGDPSIARILTGEERHHLPVIVIGEYRYGLVRSRHRGRLGRLLDLLIHESIVLPVDVETTLHYANVREGLRRTGHPIPENDVWVAALSTQYDLPIVSRDVHFDQVAGARRLDW